ncbi:hypothetical protein ACOMHN_060042 [Nucella lapillus]
MEEFLTMPATTEETSSPSSFFLTTLNVTGDLHSTSLDPYDLNDPGDSDKIDLINTRFRQFGVIPMTSFGLVGNALSLWVWSAESVYNSTIFLLKVLALWDCVVCAVILSTAVGQVAGLNMDFPSKLFTIVVLISQICSVYTTLLSSVTRLLAIFRPAHFNTILSRPRVVALCVAILLWSLLLSSFEASLYVCWQVKSKLECPQIWNIVVFYRQNYIYDFLAFCIPTLLLLAVNLLTVWKFSRHSNDVSGASSNQQNGHKTRRLSITMVTISVTSLLSYPIAVSVRLGLNPVFPEPENSQYRITMFIIEMMLFQISQQ